MARNFNTERAEESWSCNYIGVGNLNENNQKKDSELGFKYLYYLFIYVMCGV